jgi:glycosyltransferase involved in cell wall biosynthesis
VTDVSVIIPTRNRRRLLELSLRSVLWQRDVNFEVIVVDDGSTDDTSEMVRSLQDSRIRLVRHERAQGVSGARNRGIAEAGSEWVAFLDDDDLWAPDKLALQLEALRRTGCRWAYAGAVDITRDNRVFAGQSPVSAERVVKELPIRNMVPAGSSNVIVAKKWLPAPIVFDGSLFHSADWDLWIRLARQGSPACVPKPLVAYRFHPSNASLDLEGMYSEADEIERRYGGPVDRGEFSRYLARLAKRAGWRRKSLQYYCRAALVGDRRYVMKDFIPDVWNVLADVVRSRAGRFGISHQPQMPRSYPHMEWRNEARQWVDRLVNQGVDARL